MDTLKNSNNTLLYFSNDFETIGITIKNGIIQMNNKDANDIKILAKFITKFDNDKIIDFSNIKDKLIVKYKIKNRNGCFSKTTNKYLAFITYNNELEHKATYKLTVYIIRPMGVYTNEYEYYNVYYSYFA
jgi:hypothetical protein